ncbi:MAG: tetratricopeptide repeat protein [Spirochaetales bacterium]|nr:tetratricopeptide repeat protein [Spirochaetales bacterium]
MKKLPAVLCFLCTVSFVFGDARVDAQFSVAKNRFLEADYEVALHEFQQFIRLFPDTGYDGDAYYFMGQCHYFLGDFPSALIAFHRVRHKYTASRYARVVGFWEGVVLIGMDRHEEGYDALKEYLDNGESAYRREAVYYLSVASLNLGKEQEGFAYMENLVKGDEKPEPYILVSLMKTGIASGSSEQTLFLLDSLGERYPEDAYITFLRAEMYFYITDYERSRELYSYLAKNVASVNEEIRAYLLLRELYFSKDVLNPGEFRDAYSAAEQELGNDRILLAQLWEMGLFYYHEKNVFADVVAIFQKMKASSVQVSYAAVARVVDLYSVSGDYQSAIDVLLWYLPQSVEDSADNYKTLFALASLYAQSDDWDKAMEILREENGYGPLDEKWQYLYAQGLYIEGLYEECSALSEVLLKEYPGSDYYPDILLLIARCARERGELARAEDHYRKLAGLPGYEFTKAEFISILFNQGKYREVAGLEFSREESANPVFSYYRGLSYVLLESYDKGIPLLEKLEAGAVQDTLKPYVLFYLGWSKYRVSDFKAALGYYRKLFASYPMSETVTSAKYTAGWCAFSLEDYPQASTYFTEYALRSEYTAQRNKGLFMSARSLRRTGQTNKAILTLNEVIAAENGGYWKEAYFELGEMFLETGATDRAIDAYKTVFMKDPDGTDGVRAMVEAGKAAYGAKRFDEAADLFRTLRDSGTRDEKMVDAYYYWGLAYKDAGKPYSAILVWNRLVEQYPKSVYVFEVQVFIAAMYQDMGEYKKAADIYAKLVTQFPDDASNSQIDVELDKLKFMIQGQSDREAALSARIGKQKGAQTREGREAIIELARLYILNDTRKSQLDFVLDLLLKVIDKKDDDPDTGSKALFLYGEYLSREGQHVKATEAMLDAALLSPGPEDFIAQALFRAASSAAFSGDKSDAKAIITTLRQRFPSSVWAEEGRKLEGGLK